MPDAPTHENILVIKLSALGDFVLSVGAFQAIRAHHPGARIVLLTTRPFRKLAEALGCFDEIWIDDRPPLWRPNRWLALGRRLREARFGRVYDLQRSDRSGWYFRLAGRPEWVGAVAGCSHRYVPPPGPVRHIAEREAAQLAAAGLGPIAAPDLSFLTADLDRFALVPPYALLAPGSAPHRPTLREKLIKIGAKIVRHGRYATFQMAEVAISRPLFAEILRLIDGLRPAPLPP